MGRLEREAKCRALARKHYAAVPSREAVMDQRVVPLLSSTRRLLDAGCGSTTPLLEKYGPRVAVAVGIDLVPPDHPRDGRLSVVVGDLGRLPFRAESFDVIVSRSVVEHLEDPARVFAELCRVLKRDGQVIFTTPNRFYYSSLIAGLIPFSWKDFYMRRILRDPGYDHFPVFYRANSRGRLNRIAREVGLKVTEMRAVRHFPYYLLFSPTLFRLGILYDWIITRLRLDGLQSTWLVMMTRV